MKKILSSSTIAKVFFIATLALLASCQTRKEGSKIYTDILGGKHKLRKFNVVTQTKQQSSAWFFVVGGGYESETIHETSVRFYFLNYKNEYELMEFPLSLVNVKIDNTAKRPYVKFYWNENRDASYDAFHELYSDICRVVICCKDSDFNPEININSLR